MVGAVWPGIDGLALGAGLVAGLQLGHQAGLFGLELDLALAHGFQHDGLGRGAGLGQRGGGQAAAGVAAAAHLILGLGARRFGRVSLRAFSSSTSRLGEAGLLRRAR